jgi:hypothetical protein
MGTSDLHPSEEAPFLRRVMIVALVAVPAFAVVRLAVGPEGGGVPDDPALTAPGAHPERLLEAQCEGELYPWFAFRDQAPELARFCEPMPSLPITVDARPHRLVVRVAPKDACAPLRPHVYVDGRRAAVGPWLGYAGDPKGRPRDSGPIALATYPAGRHRVAIRMETEPGEGCATGAVRALAGWAADVAVTPEPVGAPLEAACRGGDRCAASSTVALEISDGPARAWALLDLEAPPCPLRPHLLVDGAEAATGPWLGAAKDPEAQPTGTGWVDLGVVQEGLHSLAVVAEPGPSGCDAPAWRGRVHTRQRPATVGRFEVECPGGACPAAPPLTVAPRATARLMAEALAGPDGCTPTEVILAVDGRETTRSTWPAGARRTGPLDLGVWPAGPRVVSARAEGCAGTWRGGLVLEAAPSRKGACLRNRMGWYVGLGGGLYGAELTRLDGTACLPQGTLRLEDLNGGRLEGGDGVLLRTDDGEALTVGEDGRVRTASTAAHWVLTERGAAPGAPITFAKPLQVLHTPTGRALDDRRSRPSLPGRWLEAHSELLETDQTFYLEGSPFGPTTFACLRTAAGRFLSAEEFNPDVVGDRRRCQGWERLQFIDLDGAPLVAGDQVLLRAHRGTFLGDRPHGALRDDLRRAETWEVFVLEKRDGLPGDVLDTSGRQVALRASHGRYLSVPGTGVADARAKGVGPSETFTLDLSPP